VIHREPRSPHRHPAEREKGTSTSVLVPRPPRISRLPRAIAEGVVLSLAEGVGEGVALSSSDLAWRKLSRAPAPDQERGSPPLLEAAGEEKELGWKMLLLLRRRDSPVPHYTRIKSQRRPSGVTTRWDSGMNSVAARGRAEGGGVGERRAPEFTTATAMACRGCSRNWEGGGEGERRAPTEREREWGLERWLVRGGRERIPVGW
jgi:hypothetical protein